MGLIWVVDTNERVTFVHRGPTENGWTAIVKHVASENLATPAFPSFQFKLDDVN